VLDRGAVDWRGGGYLMTLLVEVMWFWTEVQ